MTVHPRVTQLRFARSEFVRCLEGVSAEEARRRFDPMNCISWIVGHLTNQEHFFWVVLAQGESLVPELNNLVGYGQPPSRPDLEEMWLTWRSVTAAADTFLGGLTPEDLTNHLSWRGQPRTESIGTMLLRNTYHYWFHLGEAHAIRQMLGHRNLPEFVGDMSFAPFRPEPASRSH